MFGNGKLFVRINYNKRVLKTIERNFSTRDSQKTH